MKDPTRKKKTWKKWGYIFLGWTGFALFFTSQGYLIQARFSDSIDWLGTLVNTLIWSYEWNLVTPFILRLSNRFPLQRGKLLRAIRVHTLAALFFFIIVTAIYVIARRVIFGANPDLKSQLNAFLQLVPSEVHAGLMVYFVIVGINQAIDYYRRYRDKELRASNLEAHLVQAQLDALRMQLHPHFLFNALNSIAVLMRKDIDAADRMLLQLSNLLRVTMGRNAAHEIPLKQELEILERYLDIERIRFQDRLTVKMHIDPATLEALVPQLFFQPLVENALRHGIADRETDGVIDIRADRRDGMVTLQVRDNGPGLNMPQGDITEGVGLSNTRSRLIHLYGSASRFEVGNAKGGGLVVAAAFPFHTATMIEIEAKR